MIKIGTYGAWSRLPFIPNDFDLARPHKDPIVWFTVEVCNALDSTIVLALRFIELDADPFAC